MKRTIFLALFAALLLDAFPQSWESVRSSSEYIYGEGWGANIAEARQQALDNLIGKIATHVSGQTNSTVQLTNKNGTVSETSQFSQAVKTYSQATLTNTEEVILQYEPDVYMVRWIKKTEIEKIFEARKRKAIDLVQTAERCEEKGIVDIALRSYYWALTLLKSLQYPNEVEYNGHILTNWIKEQMDHMFREINVSYAGDERLWITYKGKPIGGVDFTYFDGQRWSPCHAKDGYALLELPPNHANTIQLRFEYEYFGQSHIDKELESVLSMVKGTPMPQAQTSVALTKVTRKKEKEIAQTATMSFTSANAAMLAPPKTMDEGAADYMDITKAVVKAIEKNDYDGLDEHFTPEGLAMFDRLMKYGKAKIVDTSNLRFYEHEGMVEERGLKLSFTFKVNMMKTFVEDVILTFNGDKKISNIAFGLGRTAEDDILNKGVWDERSRFTIMNLLENYKTAYALERLDYIASIFDDDAVIITGTVLKKAPKAVNIENRASISSSGNQIIVKNRQTKTQYLENLKRCFDRNEFVNIQFADNDVRKLGGKWGEAYAIQIAQDYHSSTYGDQGYLMLYIDINKPERPLIKLRTWQPEKDPDFGIYGPGHF